MVQIESKRPLVFPLRHPQPTKKKTQKTRVFQVCVCAPEFFPHLSLVLFGSVSFLPAAPVWVDPHLSTSPRSASLEARKCFPPGERASRLSVSDVDSTDVFFLSKPQITRHFRYLKWRYSPIKAVCKAYVRENPSPKWPYEVQCLHFRYLKLLVTQLKKDDLKNTHSLLGSLRKKSEGIQKIDGKKSFASQAKFPTIQHKLPDFLWNFVQKTGKIHDKHQACDPKSHLDTSTKWRHKFHPGSGEGLCMRSSGGQASA